MLAILMMASQLVAVEKSPQSVPITVSIVLDTSWSNEHAMPDYRSLSRQMIASLRPGDYLEIITGHPGRAKLRFAQFIKSGDAQEIESIMALLKDVKCPIFSNVNISKSVDMALKRLIQSAKDNAFAHTTVIVFTDGKLSNSDVARLQQLSREFKRKDWSLCLTGTSATNKRLLVAATQGQFKFSLLRQANPITWIQSRREITMTKPAPTEVPPKGDSGATQDSDKTGYSIEIGSTIMISEGKEKASDTSPVEIPGDGQQKPQTLLEPITKTLEAEPNESSADAMGPDIPSEESQEEVIAEPTETKGPLKFNKRLLWLVPAVGLLTVLALLFLSNISKAKKFKSSITSRLKTTSTKDTGTLIAEMNGQTHNLGRPDRIKAINIGRDSRNTIKPPDKSLSLRHATIYRKGKDLMIKNIGASPIAVNGLQVKPKAKQRLIMPSVVQLSDQTKLNLKLQKPKTARSENRSNDNDSK